MAALRVISADSHMMEPAELWVGRLDRKFRDRAPRVVKNEGKPGYAFVAPGINPFPVAGGFARGLSGKELKEHMAKGYEAARPSGWDPVERIKDQDIDGVEAEVLYTTLGMPLFQLDDAELQRACFRVYNDWVAEFRSCNPKRLHPIALISLEDLTEGIKELERCTQRGLKGAMIWGSPPADRPYSSKEYDPFWQAASELHMPLSLHVITTASNISMRSLAPCCRSSYRSNPVSMCAGKCGRPSRMIRWGLRPTRCLASTTICGLRTSRTPTPPGPIRTKSLRKTLPACRRT